jgi:putative NADH-flavin reductase
MHITIFGATSPTGRLLVEKALAQGHEVTAFVRSPANFPLQHERLTLATGDAFDAASVEKAVQGAQAVLSAIGPKGKPAAITAPITHNIAAAMKKHGAKRLVVVSVGGISVAQDRRVGFDRLLSGLLKLLLREAFDDRQKQLQVLENSGLEWVAVRVPRLLDAPATGQVYAGYWQAGVGFSLTRADLADFMLAQLHEDTWLRQAPVVCNR